MKKSTKYNKNKFYYQELYAVNKRKEQKILFRNLKILAKKFVFLVSEINTGNLSAFFR